MQQHFDGLSATLAGGVDAVATTLTFQQPLTYAGGLSVPTISSPDTVRFSLLDADGRLSEMVDVTAYTSGATTATVQRARASSTAKVHAAGARLVAGVYAGDLAAGGGGGGGTLLLENDEDGTDVPGGTAVGTIIYRKAPGVETWDFRGASALPTGWSRRGIASENFDAAGMSAAVAGGQGWVYTPPAALADDVTLEVRLVTTSLSNMMGAGLIRNTDGNGAAAVGYNNPSGTLAIGVSNWSYGSNFADSGGSPVAPVWMRIVKVGATWTAQYGADGATWNGAATRTPGVTPDRLFIGNMIGGAATMKVEQVRLEGGGQPSGRLGWWDGSEIVAF